MPNSFESALDLWTRDPYHFQQWAVSLVEGIVLARQSGDKGIDGWIFFDLPDQKDCAGMVLEVKGGQNPTAENVRSLGGVLDREPFAEMAGLILLHPPGTQKRRNFETEMAAAGHLEVKGRKHPRMQILTIEEILAGKQFDLPAPPRTSRDPNRQLTGIL
ncbi:MAG: hypothetical protein GDA55_07920 [Cellvibrionales bacterium]|nr:hypothetical protein [Cellvibrionales bacterium]